jgi:hypothetical protein
MGTLATKLILQRCNLLMFSLLFLLLNLILLVFSRSFRRSTRTYCSASTQNKWPLPPPNPPPPIPHNKLIPPPKPQITQYILRFPAERHRRGITQKLGSFMENDQPYFLIEYRAVSGVFQNIDPPPPSPPSECVLPPHRRRGVHTHRAVGGWGGGQYFGRRQTLDWPLTV